MPILRALSSIKAIAKSKSAPKTVKINPYGKKLYPIFEVNLLLLPKRAKKGLTKVLEAAKKSFSFIALIFLKSFIVKSSIFILSSIA